MDKSTRYFRKGIPCTERALATGASVDAEDNDSDVEWMDSEPPPDSQLPSQHAASVRPSGAGSVALKPPLPPSVPARPSAHPSVNHNQISLPAAPSVQQLGHSIGRHQSSAAPHPHSQPQSPKLAAGFPVSQQHSQGSPESAPDSHAHSPGHTAVSQVLQTEQQGSPITSPFKKVPSPWEKGRQQQPASQASPSPAPTGASKHILGKRKQMSDDTHEATDATPVVQHLQDIIAQTDDTTKDTTRDGVLEDILEHVPDDQPMPVSLEDRGIGLCESTTGNTKGMTAAPHQANAIKGTANSDDDGMQEDVVDMTLDTDLTATKSHANSAPHLFGFADNEDAALESGLIAALDKSSSQHQAAQEVRHQQHLPNAAAAAADDQASPSGQQDQPAVSQPAGNIHQQQQHEQQDQQPLHQTHTWQQQQQHTGGVNDLGASVGVSGSLPAPSEVGLGEYGSAALDPGLSMGVSSTLPSFDLDSEIASLDKQTKVSICARHLSMAYRYSILMQNSGVLPFLYNANYIT